MQTAKYFGTVMVLFLGLILISSCERENFDVLDVEEDVVTPEVITINNGEGNSCDDSNVTVSSDVFNLDVEAVAYLLKEDCNGLIDSYDHNYLVVLEPNFDPFFLGTPIGLPSGGIPGISFGSNGAPNIGDVLNQYGVGHFDSRIIPDWDNTMQEAWIVDDATTITIESNGVEEGEKIGGTVAGTLALYYDPTVTASFTATFCAEIIKVCE